MRERKQINYRCESKQNRDKTTDIYLYGDVGESFWGEETITSKKVRDLLDITDSEVVNVHLNTCGGDAFEGVAICNNLRNTDKMINIYVDGIAASAGSMIAMAGDKIFMYENSEIMIHKPSTIAYGTDTDFLRVAESLKTIESSYIATYMNKFKGTEEELRALLENETFFTANEALELGFCDEIITINNNKDNSNVKQMILNKYQIQEPETKSDPKLKIENKKNKMLENFIKMKRG